MNIRQLIKLVGRLLIPVSYCILYDTITVESREPPEYRTIIVYVKIFFFSFSHFLVVVVFVCSFALQ